MDKAKLIDSLNHAISLELCALLQYNQNQQMLMGADRRLWRDFFKDMSDHGLEDAREFGSRVVALGGVPTHEPAPVRQARDVEEMLRNALHLEQQLVDAYTDALSHCLDNPAYRNLIEEQILHETKDVEDLEKYLNQVKPVAQQPVQRTQTA